MAMNGPYVVLPTCLWLQKQSLNRSAAESPELPIEAAPEVTIEAEAGDDGGSSVCCDEIRTTSLGVTTMFTIKLTIINHC